jgi:hypothetical protein
MVQTNLARVGSDPNNWIELGRWVWRQEGFWIRGTIHDARTSRLTVGINCGKRVSGKKSGPAMKSCKRKGDIMETHKE